MDVVSVYRNTQTIVMLLGVWTNKDPKAQLKVLKTYLVSQIPLAYLFNSSIQLFHHKLPVFEPIP